MKIELRRGLTIAVVSLAVCLVGCERREELAAPAPSGSASSMAAQQRCFGDQRDDPDRTELYRARKAFEAGEYQRARDLLDELLMGFPHSATLRVRRADAILFDEKADYKLAAQRALEFYDVARGLRALGCHLEERDDYYLAMGQAYAELRLGHAAAAEPLLLATLERWPDSTEALYHLARAACLKPALDSCLERLARAFDSAKALKRLRFLRTHYTLDDWIRRSATQSEFKQLRLDKRYTKLVADYSVQNR